MPSKRKPNAAKNQAGKTQVKPAAQNRRRQKAPVEPVAPVEDPKRAAVKNDVTGVVVAVIAIAMFISLLTQSQAPVTQAIENVLTLGFGAGAMFVPIALFLFSLTFFMVKESLVSSRVASGLALIVLAVLAILSCVLPGADLNPDVIFLTQNLSHAGGYVGGILAWCLLKTVGQSIALVVLAGLVITGIIVCGFTISGFVAKISNKAHETRAERDRVKAVDNGFFEEDMADGSPIFDDEPEAKTTFLGERKTTLLKRKGASASHATLLGQTSEDSAPAAELKTIVLKKEEPATTKLSRSTSKKKKEDAQPQQTQMELPKLKDAKDNKLALAPVATSRPGDGQEGIQLPPLDILASNPKSASSASSKAELVETGNKLQATLAEFGLSSKVVGYVSGPLVTTFKIEMGEGERVNRITNLQDDIQLALASESVRIFAPIPGTSLVGIEIPNRQRQSVCLGDVLPYAQGGPLEFCAGRDSEGKPVVANLAKMPHLLIAGTTGSGKSVMINSIIMSILMRATPDQVRLILVDPKRVEFSCYNGLPHLYVPVVTEPRQAASALQWAVSEMERRLKVFQKEKVRNIVGYNKLCVSGDFEDREDPPQPMPYLVVVIDELSDLMMVAGKDVEASIVRLAQLARAAGIHLVIATQRPSADVVTGLIKSNIDSRIALKVSSSIDSRVILDSVGAERLLGYGDMLFRYSGSQTRRILACYTSDAEIEAAVDFIRQQGEPDYHDEILTAVVPNKPGASNGSADTDPLLWEAAQIVVDSQIGSTSGLQRRLSVGYARAGRIMDILESKGVVGPADGSKPREVFLDNEGLEQLKAAEAEFGEVE